MRFRFKKIGPIGEYEVLLDDVKIGTVIKWERHYNLRRLIVSKGWRAITASGERLFHADGYTSETREGAAKALAEIEHS